MLDIVTMRSEITISRPAEEVFSFISDGSNDPKWRTEVYRMDVSGPPQLDTQWVEYSKFFKFFETVTPTVVKEFNAPHRVTIETPIGHPTWLRSVREVTPNGALESTLSYELAFERAAMRQLLPMTPPASIITWWYSPRIAKYLKNVKRLLEKKQ